MRNRLGSAITRRSSSTKLTATSISGDWISAISLIFEFAAERVTRLLELDANGW